MSTRISYSLQSNGISINVTSNVLSALKWEVICSSVEKGRKGFLLTFGDPVDAFALGTHIMSQRNSRDYKGFTVFTCEPAKKKS